MEKDKELAVFQGKNIRKTWHKDEWWFSVFDIISVLTDSSDPKQYIKKMRSRDPVLDANWGTICTPPLNFLHQMTRRENPIASILKEHLFKSVVKREELEKICA